MSAKTLLFFLLHPPGSQAIRVQSCRMLSCCRMKVTAHSSFLEHNTLLNSTLWNFCEICHDLVYFFKETAVTHLLESILQDIKAVFSSNDFFFNYFPAGTTCILSQRCNGDTFGLKYLPIHPVKEEEQAATHQHHIQQILTDQQVLNRHRKSLLSFPYDFFIFKAL